MTCKKCGMNFSDETNFCPNCGTPTFSKAECPVYNPEPESAQAMDLNYKTDEVENDFNIEVEELAEIVKNESAGCSNLPVPVGEVYDETPESVLPYGVKTRQMGYYNFEDEIPGKGFGLTSMILGIVALFFVFSQQWVFALPFGVAGLVFGCISKSKANRVGKSNWKATVGFICSIVALGICVFAIMNLFGDNYGRDSVPFGDGDIDL